MRRVLSIVLVLILLSVLVFTFTACSNESTEEVVVEEQNTAEEVTNEVVEEQVTTHAVVGYDTYGYIDCGAYVDTFVMKNNDYSGTVLLSKDGLASIELNKPFYNDGETLQDVTDRIKGRLTDVGLDVSSVKDATIGGKPALRIYGERKYEEYTLGSFTFIIQMEDGKYSCVMVESLLDAAKGPDGKIYHPSVIDLSHMVRDSYSTTK